MALAALAPGASFRPQLFTMLGLAIEWALLLRADARLFGDRTPIGWELTLVPLVMLAWTNAHGGFPIGIALHGIFVAGVIARSLAARAGREPAPPARAMLAVLASGVATLAATAVNPYGTGLHRYLATTLAEHGRITEWMPIPLLSAAHAPFELLVAATVACAIPWLAARGPRSARLDWSIAFVALAVVAAFRHQRHSVLATIVATPVLLVAAEHVRRRAVAAVPSLVPRRPVAAAIGAGVIGVALLQLVQVAARFSESGLAIRYAREEFPADAVAFLAAHDVRGNMAVQFEWGGYTLFYLGDRARVFLDGRYEASYPAAVIEDYFAFVEARPAGRASLDVSDRRSSPIDGGVVPRLDERRTRARVYADRTAGHLRRTPANGPPSRRRPRSPRVRRRAPELTLFP